MAQEIRTVEQRTPQTAETAQRSAPRPMFLPPADIYETRDNIVVLTEMPGVALDGVDITLERRVLTIRGRSATNDHAGYQRVYNEYADGDYERAFTLSENIDRDRIEATLRNGASRPPQGRDRESAKDRDQIRVTRPSDRFGW